MNQDQFPQYHLLPWEVEWAKNYAEESAKKFKNARQFKNREPEQKLLDAYAGAAGELAFKEMLDKEVQSMIKEWTSETGEMGSHYDFLFDNGAGEDVKVDVKTTSSESKYIKSAEECNFWYAKDWIDRKKSWEIPLADLYIQMFYDIEKETAYFIGAVTTKHLFELEKTKSVWNGGFKVKRENMDATPKWMPYLNKSAN